MNPVQNAAILAGGLSSRMGRDKALLEVEGEPLIRRTVQRLEPIFENLIVVTNRAEVGKAAGVKAIADAHASKGPLTGIEAALLHFQQPVFIVACDLPFLNADLIRFQCGLWRSELDAFVAQGDHGLEPLHAIWSNSALTSVQAFLQEERPPSLRRVLGELKVETLGIEDARCFDARLRCFENWNTPDDVKI